MDAESKKIIEWAKNNIPLARSDDFDVDYHNYLYDKNETLTVIRQAMRERRHAVGKTAVAYRVINHWEEKGLLPKREADEGWRKFSFVEIVWLKAVSRLRKQGIPIENIARAKKGVMQWDKEERTYPILEYYIAKALKSPIDPYVFVLPDGRATTFSSREIEDYKGLHGSNDAILISIKSILKELGANVTKPETLRGVAYAEGQLLNEIRGGDTAELRAKIKDRKLRKMENRTEVKKFPETLPLGDILGEVKKNTDDFFGVLEIKFQNGKQQSASISTLQRSRHFTSKSSSRQSL